MGQWDWSDGAERDTPENRHLNSHLNESPMDTARPAFSLVYLYYNDKQPNIWMSHLLLQYEWCTPCCGGPHNGPQDQS